MIIHDCEQRSEEWFAVKLGVPSAGSMDKIITTKGEPSKQAKQYMYQLAGEKVSQQHQPTFSSFAMERGTAMEDEARAFYELAHDVAVEQVGFITTDDLFAGCSPDGLVGATGGLEIKCPLVHTHVEYLLKGVLPTAYYQQVQASLWVTRREWWDFMSYYPGLKPLLVRVYPDFKFFDRLAVELACFNDELKKVIEAIS